MKYASCEVHVLVYEVLFFTFFIGCPYPIILFGFTTMSVPIVCFPFQDATANDVPSDTFDVKGYPTLYFRSSSGKVVQYDGDRTKEGIIDFIEKNRDKAEGDKAEEKVAGEEEKVVGKDEL